MQIGIGEMIVHLVYKTLTGLGSDTKKDLLVWMKTKMAKVYYSLVCPEYDHDVMHMNYMYHIYI